MTLGLLDSLFLLSSFCHGFTDVSSLMIYILNLCAYDVDLRKLHKWFLRHPWKRYLRFDGFSSNLNLKLLQYKLFLHRYNNGYTIPVINLYLVHF